MKKKLLVLVTVLAVMFAFAGCGVKITDISLADITMEKGESVALNAEFVADKADADAEALAKAIEKLGVTFTVADETIAKLDGTTLTALEAGETTITAASADGTLSVTAKVVVQAVVEEVKAEDILVNTADGSVAVEYTLLPKGAKAEKIEFAVADENVATVKDGKLAVVAAGKTELTITADGVEKTIAVVVLQAPVELSAEDVSVEVGKTATIEVDTGLAEGLKAEVGAKYTYKVSDEKIATVDENGVVTGVAAGKTEVRVTNTLGQGCTVEVEVTEFVRATTSNSDGANGSRTQGQNGGVVDSGSTGSAGNNGGGSQAPAPTPDPTPAPSTPDPAPQPAPPAQTVVCPYCGGDHTGPYCPMHYHGNGTDAGTCPVCGRGYSPVFVMDPDTEPGPLETDDTFLGGD